MRCALAAWVAIGVSAQAARAQVEPIALTYDAPPGCRTADEFHVFVVSTTVALGGAEVVRVHVNPSNDRRATGTPSTSSAPPMKFLACPQRPAADAARGPSPRRAHASGGGPTDVHLAQLSSRRSRMN
ncbi:MAG: hypothetical protein ABTD50_01885 [Polyangiaceae bacterium]|jgi:hypothetical protein